jgi:hypothetical protein
MTFARIGTVFHETLTLNRPSLSNIIELAGSGKSFDLKTHTNLGNNYIKAMPPYAVGAGLLEDNKTNRLTPLGETVLAHDPDLNHPATLWLMHYHLSAPKGPGPAFWHHLVSQVLHPGEQLRRYEIKELLDAFLRQGGTELADKSLNSTTSIFTGTYTKSDALGKLGILRGETDDDRTSTFEVSEPDAPPTFALGYALAHYWDQEVDALRTNLSSLSAPGGFASLFFIGTYGLNSALRELQREGYVELEQISPPHQLVRRWASKDAFLERLYE